MAAPKLNITIPAAPAKKSAGSPYQKWMDAHPAMKQYSNQISQWSHKFGVAPQSVAAIIWKESKGVNAPYNPGVQGAGITQINPGKGPDQAAFESQYGKLDPMNTGQSIEYLSWVLAANNNEDVDTFYQNVWNPGFKPSATSPLPGTYLKGYSFPPTAGATPTENAVGTQANKVAVAQLPATQKDLRLKYYTQLQQQGISAGYTPAQAKQLAQRAIGSVAAAKVPATETDQFLNSYYALDTKTLAAQLKARAAVTKQNTNTFNRTKTTLDPIYLAYTGKVATDAQVKAFLSKPTSTYQLELNLADPKKNPSFLKSPTWQTHAPAYQSYFQNIFGPGVKAPQSVLNYAIVHNLDEGAFESELRNGQVPGQPNYMTSEAYKQGYATFQSDYANIYGMPDQQGQMIIHEAVLKGWSEQQLQNYLRALPGYTGSGEYQNRAYSLASQLGLIQGAGRQNALGLGAPVAPGATTGPLAGTQAANPTPVQGAGQVVQGAAGALGSAAGALGAAAGGAAAGALGSLPNF